MSGGSGKERIGSWTSGPPTGRPAPTYVLQMVGLAKTDLGHNKKYNLFCSFLEAETPSCFLNGWPASDLSVSEHLARH
jgi:hypothetical protein